MASNAPYPEPDASMSGTMYGAPNGAPSPVQQQQHMASDADLQLQENIAQLQRSNDMMQAAPGQPQQLGQMNPLTAAHHHFQSPPRPTHSPQQMAQTVMNLDEHNMYSDQDASRKRSKVSRACDECRRKKIRCDATSENGAEPCSSCKRTGARCQFSRQPMKRGPSKGYIKELADRLNSLENQIHQHPHGPPPTFDYPVVGDHSLNDPHTPSHLSRKRTHSMSEGLQDPHRGSSWSAPDRDFTTNGQTMRQSSFSDMTLAGSLLTGSNEATIKAYYNSIHPVLPILSHDASTLNRLTNCSPKVREAFFLTLECAVRSVSPSGVPGADLNVTQLLQQGFDSLHIAETSLADVDPARQFNNKLAYCQSLELLIIASDKPASTNGLPDPALLLARLAGMVIATGLYDAKMLERLRDQDRETLEEARRVFWVAFILDRFLASVRGKDSLLPMHYGSASREDLNAMGEVAFYLARAAQILASVTKIIRAGEVPNPEHRSSPLASATSESSTLIYDLIDGFRLSLDLTNLVGNSPPHLALQYLRLLLARQHTQTPSKDTLDITKELLHNLIVTPITPLHHVFAYLVAAALTDLSDRVETQVEAQAAIKEMDDAIANGQIVHRVFNGTGWDMAIRNLLHHKKGLTPASSTAVERTSPAAPQPNMAGLQHLAAAAVGERDSADGRPGSSGGPPGTGAIPPPVQDSLKNDDVAAAMAAASEAAAAQAQATAAAAQQQLQDGGGDGGHGGENGNGSGSGNGNVVEGF
ncbi:uncharacterized protein EI97DRAFT_432941 [Westerdykella ornata]|uniref:Zn(2)-C6 fungal-type domain-containing protein n=1 Tax=Westerdykella ornata TaxID=318751 RepID=A0A6A6JKB3_WESOR|nr:uncharacterized protein EI97DRAFT_432941 [Westerdykella ornata]KAF2276694.1 hypothetical protein EI97DRAFT_432941 [Westerdykella ornata]